MARTKRPPRDIFEHASHSVSIKEDPPVLNDDADTNPNTNNQNTASLNLDKHIARTNSNQSSNHKNIHMNNGAKMLSNNPRTLANHRAKEKRE